MSCGICNIQFGIALVRIRVSAQKPACRYEALMPG